MGNASVSVHQGLLAAPVGPGCANRVEDVRTVQRLLEHAVPGEQLRADGVWGPRTAAALRKFREIRGEIERDSGQVQAHGKTLAALVASLPGELSLPHLAVLYLGAPEEALRSAGISMLGVMQARHVNTPLRQAHFLAQVGHESGELRHRQELGTGQAYEGRAALGNTTPGDGPRYKGRGLIQLTGRANYAAYGRSLGREQELLASPELLATDDRLCADVAGWFWETRQLNALADADDLARITRRVNGGLNGLPDRSRLLRRAKALLGIACKR